MVAEVYYDHLIKLAPKPEIVFLFRTRKVKVSRSAVLENHVPVLTTNLSLQDGCDTLWLHVSGHKTNQS